MTKLSPAQPTLYINQSQLKLCKHIISNYQSMKQKINSKQRKNSLGCLAAIENLYNKTEDFY